MVLFEEVNQHVCGGSADDSMSAWVGRIRSSIANLREPSRIRHRVRVFGRIGSANGSYRSPKVVCVLGIVEGNYRISESKVQQCKQPGILRRRQAVRYRRGLG